MKVKRIGLKITNNNKTLDFNGFMAYLMSAEVKKYGYESGERFFLFSEDKNFYSGVILTFKDQRKDCRARFQDGKFTIHTKDVLSEDKLIDFNFFAFKKKSLRGLFEYYHNSCSIYVLFRFMRNHFENLKEEKKTQYIHDNRSIGAELAEKKATKMYSGRLVTQILLDERDIPSVLSEYAKVKKIEMSYYADHFSVGHAIALQKSSKEVKVTFNITDSEQSKIGALTAGVVELAGATGFKKGNVRTVDNDDVERTISILNSPKQLGECEFDSLAHKIDGLTVDNFADNSILVELKKEILEGEYHALFD